MANQWFKFYGGEYLSDPKMDRLTVQERSCWLTLLCMASQSNGIIKYISVEGLLNKSGIHFNPYDTTEWDNAQNVLKTFETYEMISVHKNGNVTITNWNKRQDHNLTVSERVAKSRAKRKNVTTDVTNVTSEYSNVTNVTLEENRYNVPVGTSKETATDSAVETVIDKPAEKYTDFDSFMMNAKNLTKHSVVTENGEVEYYGRNEGHKISAAALTSFKKEYAKLTGELLVSHETKTPKGYQLLDDQEKRVFDTFTSIDPNAGRMSWNPRQIASMRRLIKNYGEKVVCEWIKVLPQTNGKQFFPIISNFVDLENNWAKLLAQWQRNN